MWTTRSIVTVAAMLLAATSQLCAGTITFTTAQNPFPNALRNQGWWSTTAANGDGNTTYSTGKISPIDTLRSFFTFDIGSLGAGDTIHSATLRIERGTSGPQNEAIETLEFFDVTTAAATLNQNDGINAAIYADLGTGTSYGSFNVPGKDPNSDAVLEFLLNAAAITDLNGAKGGFFSIGGTLISQDPGDDDEWLFGNSGARTPELVLDVSSATVPEPSSFALGFLGVVAIVLSSLHSIRSGSR